MKMIQAYVRGERLPFVTRELEGRGIFGMNVREVMGRGEQGGVKLQFRGGVLGVDLIPKMKLEIVVKDHLADAVADAIRKSANTGRPGDGRVFIVPVEQSIRIRTDEVEV